MHTKNITERSHDRFHPLSIWMHWGMLILMVAVYALIEMRGIYPKGSSAREAMKDWHFMLGMLVFALVFARLLLHWIFRAPPIDPAPPAWQGFLARTMHIALYAFLVGMPVLGWLALNAKGRSVPFFGIPLPTLIGPNEALAGRYEDIHEIIGIVGYYLIGLHAAAALFHHYLLRDNALRRMLPWRRRESSC